MNTSFKTHRRAPLGFTLMEIMVVLAIMLVLVTMVVSGVGYYKRKAAEKKTQVLIASVERALEEYRSDTGTFPAASGGGDDSSADVYKALYGDPDGDGTSNSGETVYLPTLDPNLIGSKRNVDESGTSYVIVDAWFEPLRYASPGTVNPDFDLWSLGPDGQGYTGVGQPDDSLDKQKDDITNW